MLHRVIHNLKNPNAMPRLNWRNLPVKKVLRTYIRVFEIFEKYIIGKQKKLQSYQKTFDTAYSLITADVNGLPSSCRRNEFTNQYIQNYDLSYSNMESNDISFMYELLQYHYNSLSDMILQDLAV